MLGLETDMIDVLGSGAVVLGPNVTCDGFHRDRSIRIQTHVHSDHLCDFTSSKSGSVVMSSGTFDLLAPDNPDFAFRPNIQCASPGEEFEIQGNRITVWPTNHMLGAVQASVRTPAGVVLGYSGDFYWPLDRTITADALVVDATYGSAESDRQYSQSEVEADFVESVQTWLRRGPVHIFGHVGTAERALHLLTHHEVGSEVAVVGSHKFVAATAVYRRHGYLMRHVHNVDSPEGKRAIRERSFIRFWSHGQAAHNDVIFEGVQLHLSKYRTIEPVSPVSGVTNTFRIGLSNHADFAGTMEYIAATKAKLVVIDNVRARGSRAESLVGSIRRELGIEARLSSNEVSLEWGK